MDTSTARGSVAVGQPGTALGRVFLDSHGGRGSELLPAVRDALSSAGVQLHELSGILVGAGPGSFTGVRIAAATAKGLARGLELPLWAFSSLAAGGATADVLSPPAAGFDQPETSLPYAGGLSGLPRCILFDARGDRVYAACYRFRPEGPPAVVIPPQSTDLRGVLAAVRAMNENVAFAGDGAQRHQEVIREAGFPVMAPPAGTPTGDGLLHLLALDPDAPPLQNPGAWEPEYLRASSAERERPAGPEHERGAGS